VAGVSQNKRRHSGQIKEQTIRHAAHATRSTPARSKQSRRFHSAEEPHGVIPTRPKVARCASCHSYMGMDAKSDVSERIAERLNMHTRITAMDFPASWRLEIRR
jgi:hypothetical protein